MKLKKIKYIVSLALALSSISVSAFAYNGEGSSYNSRAIIADSVIIDKGETNGGTTLPPKEELDKVEVESVVDKDTDSPVIKKKTGSIKISLSDTSTKNDKSNVKFSISKVADVVKGEYVLTENYKNSGVDLNNLKSANDLDIAANLLKKGAVTDKTLVTDAYGVCNVDDLDVGVYLLYAQDIANYENITPFLVSIPVWDESSKSMSYDVNVIPKHTPLPEKDTSIHRAPKTAYNDGTVYGVLSGISLAVGSSLVNLRKKKD